MVTLASLDGGSLVPDTIGTIARGSQLGTQLSTQFRTPGLAERAQAGDEAALRELAIINPTALQNVLQAPTLRDQQQVQQLIAQTQQEQARIVQLQGNIKQAIGDGDPEKVRGNLLRLLQTHQGEEGFDSQQVADLLKLSTTDPLQALEQLRIGQAGNQAELEIADQILSRLSGALPQPVSAKEQAETAKLQAEADAIRAKPGGVSLRDEAEIRKIEAGIAKTEAETAKIAREGRPGVSKTDVAIQKEERKETTKANVKRISELSKTQSSRSSSVRKAKKFKRAFEKGEAESGASRTLLGFIPGVFTDQAQFDEELDSFSEVAAREKLKAVGEIRPTDADVAGMKRALFGVGRDEQTNIQLLNEFIAEQEALDGELEDLRDAKSAGRLDVFTGTPAAAELPPGTIDNGDGTFTLPDGTVIERA